MTSRNEADESLMTPAYRRRFLIVMFVVCLFDYADRAVFNVTQESIKAEFGLTDFRLGLLGAAFALLFSVVGVPLGRLADRHNRMVIVSACTALWSAATMFCGMATNFVMMLIGRIGVGLGEAGFTGPVTSLVSDQFPPQRRASRMSLILLGAPLGILMGANVGGWAAEVFHWRAAFLLLGAPGLVAALCVLTLLREPPRGRLDGHKAEAAAQAPTGWRDFVREICRRPALLWIFGGCTMTGFGMTTISVFLASFLVRQHGLSPGEAGTVFGVIFGVSMSAGFLVGSFGTDWLSARDVRWPAWGAAIGLACAPLVYWTALTSDVLPLALVLFTLGGAMHLIFYGPTLGMIQNLSPPRMRASGASLFAMLNVLSGYLFGPPVIGFFSDRFGQRVFTQLGGQGDLHALCPGGAATPGASSELATACHDAVATGLGQAMMCGVSVFLFSALCYLMAARSLKRDMAAQSAGVLAD